jgi:hypothetical protein
MDLPAEMGDEEIDLTGAPDDEVIAVFKKMSDEDEVEVVKDEDGIHLTDNETGAEYYIKEGYGVEEGEMDMREMDEYMEEGEDSPCMHEAAGCGKHKHEGKDAVMYEIEIDEHQSLADRRAERHGEREHYGETPDGLDETQGYNDREDESLGELDEDAHWSGNLHDFKRAMNPHGVRKRRGDVDHHYKSYEGPFGGNEGDLSKSHPGKIDYSMYTEDEEVVDLDADEVEESTRRTLADRRRRDLKPSNYPTNYSTNESRKPRTSKNAERVSESKIMK